MTPPAAPTPSDPDDAMLEIRLAIRAALQVMTAKEVYDYCVDYLDRVEDWDKTGAARTAPAEAGSRYLENLHGGELPNTDWSEA